MVQCTYYKSASLEALRLFYHNNGDLKFKFMAKTKGFLQIKITYGTDIG
jgi:hypothetical protein